MENGVEGRGEESGGNQTRVSLSQEDGDYCSWWGSLSSLAGTLGMARLGKWELKMRFFFEYSSYSCQELSLILGFPSIFMQA